MRGLFAHGAACAALVACHRGSAPPSPASAGSSAARPTASVTEAGSPVAQARCVAAAGGAVLAGSADSVVVGDVAPTAGGTAVGILRRNGAQVTPAIALIADDLSPPRVVDLPVGVADSPPPRPFLVGSQLFAASYTGGGPATGSWTLALFRLDDEKAGRVAQVEQLFGESAAMDVGSGNAVSLVAWDEDAPSRDRGLIKLATFDGAHLGDPRILSADTTDAEQPQVTARAGGFWVAWFGHRPLVRADAGSNLEGPAESREARWVEVVSVNDAGKPVGLVHRLVTPSGHASAFSLVSDAAAGKDDVLHVFLRDDEESSDGAGGALLQATLRADAVEPAALVAQGAGRGAPTFVRLDVPLLVYADAADHTVVLPLSSALTPFQPRATGDAAPGSPSVEPSLEGARVLGPTKRGGLILAAFPNERAASGLAPVRAFHCAR